MDRDVHGRAIHDTVVTTAGVVQVEGVTLRCGGQLRAVNVVLVVVLGVVVNAVVIVVVVSSVPVGGVCGRMFNVAR